MSTYIIHNKKNGLSKIGQSLNPNFRLKQIKREHPESILIAKSEFASEKRLHKLLKEYRVDGEWFKLTDGDIQLIIESAEWIKGSKNPTQTGRPSEKKEGIEYVKLSARIPTETRKRLKTALHVDHVDKFKTQDEIINFALLYFLDNYKS